MAAYFKHIAAALFAAIALAACSKDLPETTVAEKPYGPYTFIIGGETRTLLGEDQRGRFAQWETGDRIGTLLATGSGVAAGHAAVNPGSPVSFSLYHQGGFEAGDVVRAYYPYSSATTGPEDVRLSIPVSQSQNGGVFDLDAMPMVSDPYEITQVVTDNDNPVGELFFANMAAMAEFRIFSSNGTWAGETVTSVRFESDSPLAGEFSMDISGVSFSNPESLAISGYSATDVTTAVADGPQVPASQGDAISVYMVLAPGTYGGAVVITTDKAVYRFPLKNSQTFSRAVIRALGVDLGTCADRTTSAVSTTVTKTIKQILTGMGSGSVANGDQFEILRMDDVVTIETNGYNNCGKVYSSGNQWRVYAADYGNIKIKVAPGYELQSVTLNYTLGASGTTYPEFLGPASNSATAVSGCSVTYHVGGTLGNVQFTKFSVTYIESPFTPDRVYLDCYEMPAVDITVSYQGMETFVDDVEGTGRWIGFDTPDAGLRLISHTFLYGGRPSRNYTTMMHKDRRCPLWVAYPMHSSAYANNNAGRDINFNEKKSYDPAIPASWQSSGSTYDYNGGKGYSRGHLCASEDRQVTKGANYQTFYYTNQAPQIQNGFNSGVWSSLEGAVQSAAPSGRDTLYVVSGTLYDPEVFDKSNDWGNVARPSHFYKLLMLCSFDTSGTMTAARGAAYLYTNESHSGATYSASTFRRTIDEIEELAGFDFFAAVPKSLQDGAESVFSSIL